jgi:uncharacterized zinc-type alcohol dehydrogenase-like protein
MLPTKAYAAPGPSKPLAPFQLNRREPGPHDVAIDIKYCGVCHSDVHQAREEWGKAIFPMVPGHEIAGIVSRVGAKVSKFRAGDRVGVGCFVDSCRDCGSCRDGFEQYCEHGMTGTYNDTERDDKTPTYGGYSTRIVVDENYVLRIPESIPLDRAAPLLCAGITLYSPLARWKAGPGRKVAIAGLGGLGHMGVKLAHAMGAEVTVLSHSTRKQEDARRLGADHFHSTADTATFARLAGSFDLIVDTVSADHDLNAYLGLLRRDGVMVLVGAPPTPPPVHAFGLIVKRRSLAGSMIGGIRETQEMLDFCGKHGIGADIELIPAGKINEAYERMIRSDVRYRFVIDIATL